jgi:CDP-diacylglycerol--serine O-phosphatidyltransferase
MKQHLPNFFTASNLFCGMVALVFIGTGNITGATIMVATSLLMDLLDGLVARAVGVSSPIGKELDSLADMVSFGAVPGFVMARLIQEATGGEFLPETLWTPATTGEFPWFLAGFIITILSAVRLARFNLDERQSDAFFGVPTPTNTVVIFSLWMTREWQADSWLEPVVQNHWLLLGITLLCSYLLIADIRLIANKFEHFRWRGNEFRYLLIILAIALLVIFQYAGVPFVLLLYLGMSFLDNRRH